MTHDYIVVGTGAAGSVLADRLSRNGKYSILVLEAGGRDWDPMHRVPKGWVFTMQNDRYVKKYVTEPFGDGRTEVWPRGWIDGGSTTVNGLGWNTGDSRGYDWDKLGNEGWDWPTFRAALDAIENHTTGTAEWNRSNGPMNVEQVNTHEQMGEAVQKAIADKGATIVPDTNHAEGQRVGYATSNTRHGARWSAAAAFLKPAVRRRNVTKINHAEVTRVLFSGTTAVGVEAEVKGKLERFAAAREVILSAGALESPQILERSGIGGKDAWRRPVCRCSSTGRRSARTSPSIAACPSSSP